MRRLTAVTLCVVVAVSAGVLAACGTGDDTTVATPTTSDPVLTDSDTTEPTVVDPASPAVAEANEVAAGFMAARVAGSGAEAYCTQQGVTTYQSAMVLYDVASFEITGLEAVDANAFEATVAITDVTGATRTETLFLGPGKLAGGTSQGMAVRGGVVAG